MNRIDSGRRRANGKWVAEPRDQAVADYVERFAQIMIDSGMPRMAARVFAALLTSQKPHCSAAELGELLEVGASAISGAVKYLSGVGLISKGREPGARRDHYAIHDGSWYGYMTQADPVFVQVEDSATEGIALLGPDTPGGARLAETRSFFAFMREETRQSMLKWKRLRRQGDHLA